MKLSPIIFKKNPLFDSCPVCAKTNSLHRSKARDWKEFILKSATYYKIYRCGQCGWRGYRSTFTLTKQTLINIGIYLSVGLIIAFIIMQILKRIS